MPYARCIALDRMLYGTAFYTGGAGISSKPGNNYVRCVRGSSSAHSFTDNGDETVTDNLTGLMWQQQDDGTAKTWQAALDYCNGLSLAGYTDWRLPNVRELESITDDSAYNPTIDTTYFPIASDIFWSSTSEQFGPGSAWNVDFMYGDYSTSDKNGYVHVLCVR